MQAVEKTLPFRRVDPPVCPRCRRGRLVRLEALPGADVQRWLKCEECERTIYRRLVGIPADPEAA
jgi:transposase-like protein